MSGEASEPRSSPHARGEATQARNGAVVSRPLGHMGEERGAPSAIIHAAGHLGLEFSDDTGAASYVLVLVSLFVSVAEELLVIETSGHARDDLDLAELKQRLQANRVASVHVRVVLPGGPAQMALAISSPRVAKLTLPLANDAHTASTLWLQSDIEFLGSIPILALPVADTAIRPDALHALVAVAAIQGKLLRATLARDGLLEPSRTWWTANPPPGARPLESVQGGAVWRITTDETAIDTPVVWCVVSETGPEQRRLPPEWWVRFRELIRRPAAFDALEVHLRAVRRVAPSWRLIDLEHAPPAHFMVPPEDGMIVSLIPVRDCVLLGIDVKQTAEVVEAALLHALAHLALGHVRPGDRWAHWDTAKTVSTEAPHRLWDQEAREFVVREFIQPATRRVESLEQCTPTEKAQLGLWRMIGEMIGENRRLHPAAERYQRAAYQRQAAQRLVSMLDAFGGAMLCDGVGLGKTYVATTVMVHYSSLWRDHWAAIPERQVEEPFRITVLAPYSVVSTWRREALPGLAAFGVPLAAIRVISHTQMSRISRPSQLLEATPGGLSDLEHLLLSDLVVVDEAHNFRSLAARRTKVLRDLLRVQPRREQRRRVLLLTATPVNNSLDDLRQEVSLLFSRPLWLSDAKTDDGYRRQAIKEIRDRCAKARMSKVRGDLAALVIHGQADARFSDTIEFRDDLDFGSNVQRVGDYLKEQDKRLKELQDRIRAAAQSGQPQRSHTPIRIAEDLLDRMVVQRSRALCKNIERQQDSKVELLFRPDAEAPEKLRYSDEYDGIQDVLSRYLPLFDAVDAVRADTRGRLLSLKIYMWHDVREGIKSPEDTSSVVGLQRVLVLKRLESSPVSFLITLLRLAVLHAHRLHQLGNLCLSVGDTQRNKQLHAEIERVLAGHERNALAKIRSLSTGDGVRDPREGFVKSLSAAYTADRPEADTGDLPLQISPFADDAEGGVKREELDRLWRLRETILQDFDTLLSVAPQLADIVFGKFERSEWPRRFIAGGEAVDWPTSPAWGLRLVTDAKLRQLVARLVAARRAGQKVVVFSQFSDTVAYIQSVLKACLSFTRNDWQLVVRGGLGISDLRSEEFTGLLATTAIITGDTEDRDEVINAFAPFYRIGPFRPAVLEAQDGEQRLLEDAWEASWTSALHRPVDVLLATDVLAEGVNLQDAALIINFDVHWNPVRMIQRAGRIDRRLNPRIEHARELPELEALAARLGRPLPRYYWHEHPGEAPIAVNMILPDELERELLLRERIATKTLAIDFTLGLEQGTGAEADWMATYRYQGIASLNSFQKDRAIEQIAALYQRLTRVLSMRGVRGEWAENLNGWFRCPTATDGSPLIGCALLGRRGGQLERFSRYLEPTVRDGVPFWFWTEKRPGESMSDGWLVLDGQPENFPPQPRRDIPFHDNVSTPVRASHLLAAAEYLASEPRIEILPTTDISRLLMQGASAFAAPKLGTAEDRRLIAWCDFFLLQLPTFEPGSDSSMTSRGAPWGLESVNAEQR
jgi:hypothetical protein